MSVITSIERQVLEWELSEKRNSLQSVEDEIEVVEEDIENKTNGIDAFEKFITEYDDGKSETLSGADSVNYYSEEVVMTYGYHDFTYESVGQDKGKQVDLDLDDILSSLKSALTIKKNYLSDLEDEKEELEDSIASIESTLASLD